MTKSFSFAAETSRKQTDPKPRATLSAGTREGHKRSERFTDRPTALVDHRAGFTASGLFGWGKRQRSPSAGGAYSIGWVAAARPPDRGQSGSTGASGKRRYAPRGGLRRSLHSGSCPALAVRCCAETIINRTEKCCGIFRQTYLIIC